MFLCLSLLENTTDRPPETGRNAKTSTSRKLRSLAKEYALRQELGVFAYFCRRLDKSKAFGGTRPAGSVFGSLQRLKEQQINDLMSSLHFQP
jgi:hypothetical protein